MLCNSENEEIAKGDNSSETRKSVKTSDLLKESSKLLRNIEKEKLTSSKRSFSLQPPKQKESHLNLFLKRIDQQRQNKPSTGMRKILQSIIPQSILNKKPTLSSGGDGNLKIMEKKTKSSLKFVNQNIQPAPIKPNLHLLNDILDQKIRLQSHSEKSLSQKTKESLDPSLTQNKNSKSLSNFFSSVAIEDNLDQNEYTEDEYISEEEENSADSIDAVSDVSSSDEQYFTNNNNHNNNDNDNIEQLTKAETLKKKKISFTIASDDDEPSAAPLIDDDDDDDIMDNKKILISKKPSESQPSNIANSLMDVEAENEDSADEDEIIDEHLIEEELREMVDDSEIHFSATAAVDHSSSTYLHSRLRKEADEGEMDILMKRFVPESVIKKGDSYRALKKKYAAAAAGSSDDSDDLEDLLNDDYDDHDDGALRHHSNRNHSPTIHTKETSLHDRIWKGLPQTQKSHSSLIKLIEKDLHDSDDDDDDVTDTDTDVTDDGVSSDNDCDGDQSSDVADCSKANHHIDGDPNNVNNDELGVKSEIDIIKEDEEHSFIYLKDDLPDFANNSESLINKTHPSKKKRRTFTLDPALENRLQNNISNNNNEANNSRNTFNIKNKK